jgi:hypothetical protein
MSMHGLLAYVGPGPGLTMVWAFLGLLGTIALAILSLLLWPIRMLIRVIRGEKTAEAQPLVAEKAGEAADVVSKPVE